MTKNILIPGAGGFACINAIKSLRSVGYPGKLISTDANSLSAGFFLADGYYILPKASDPAFIDKAMTVIKQEKIGIIFPTSGFDIFPYAQHRSSLESLGITVCISDSDTLDICCDKEKFNETVRSEFPCPQHYQNPEAIDHFPVFLKPRFGKGSRNAFLCETQRDLDYYFSKYDAMMIQEYLPGTEYTVDVLSDLSGQAIYAVARERVAVKEGISFKGRVIIDEEIEAIAMRLANFLKLKAASCIQLRRDREGILKLIEVNPRMGGGTIMTTLAGANIPYDMVKLCEGEVIQKPEIRSMMILRYYNEIVIEDKES